MKKPNYPYNPPVPLDFNLKYKLTDLPSDLNPKDIDYNYINRYVVTGCKETENVIILMDKQKHWDDPSHFCPECDDEGCKECELEYQKAIDGLSLQDIINMLPNDISPKDAKISFGADDFNGVVCATFSLMAERKLSKEKQKEQIKKYNDAVAKYDKKFDKYLEKKRKYDKWAKKQEILKLKEKLSDLERE